MPKLILQHFKLPCSIVWQDPEVNWDKCQEMLQEEISKNGFKGFKKMEIKDERDKPDDKPDDKSDK